MIDIQLTALFTVEDTKILDLNGGIRKKFTSLADSPVTYTHIYDPTIFRWDFGDGSPIYETNDRVAYRTYSRPGTYIVKHQACNFCSCSDWNTCSQSITVVQAYDLSGLATAGILGFLVFKGIDCEPRNTKETCEELIDYCQWVEKEKKCVRKCNEGYKLEKEDSKNGKVLSPDDIKKPFRLGCAPTRERLKPSKKKK